MIDYDKIDVLLVEDNDLFRKTLIGVINRSDSLRCRDAFVSGEDALRALEEQSLAPDIVLLDIGLPGINGVECIPKVKSLSPASKIVMLTIHDDDDNVFKAICAGASGYLSKDAPAEEIVLAIESVLQGGAPMNSHIAKKVLD
ncbi:MAG: DNA-binding response regulator, partial [Calditrichaeota bacterium]